MFASPYAAHARGEMVRLPGGGESPGGRGRYKTHLLGRPQGLTEPPLHRIAHHRRQAPRVLWPWCTHNASALSSLTKPPPQRCGMRTSASAAVLKGTATRCSVCLLASWSSNTYVSSPASPRTTHAWHTQGVSREPPLRQRALWVDPHTAHGPPSFHPVAAEAAARPETPRWARVWQGPHSAGVGEGVGQRFRGDWQMQAPEKQRTPRVAGGAPVRHVLDGAVTAHVAGVHHVRRWGGSRGPGRGGGTHTRRPAQAQA
jgi:hypothetical protein